jgi:hypothetical protein
MPRREACTANPKIRPLDGFGDDLAVALLTNHRPDQLAQCVVLHPVVRS